MTAAPVPDRGDPRVITFYSYKGGTGRTFALANMAWTLASNGKRVLAVDWDLEAPGLHRYFRPLLDDRELAKTKGVLDLVWRFALAALESDDTSDADWYLPLADIRAFTTSVEWPFPRDGVVDILGAGRQDSLYSTRLSTFDWNNFYERLGGGQFLQAVRHDMCSRYDYVLIDSRTGMSDTAGICTVDLPDVLVLAFTLNIQSITGAAAIADSVAAQSKVKIYPVPMRVEHGENAMLQAARGRARAEFDRFLVEMSDGELDGYWADVEVPYLPIYAYHELLAPIQDQPRYTNTCLAATEKLTAIVTDRAVTQLEVLPENDRLALRDRFMQEGVYTARPTFRSAVRCITAAGALDEIAVRVVRTLNPADTGDAEIPARLVVDRRGRRMVQKWIPAELRNNRHLRRRLEGEIQAGVRFAEVFVLTPYPAEIPRLVAYDIDGQEPYVLLEEYRGETAHELEIADTEELRRFYGDLLASVQVLQAAGVVHGDITPRSVRWDGSTVQLADFEEATVHDDGTLGDVDLLAAVRVFATVAARGRDGLPDEYHDLLEGVRDVSRGNGDPAARRPSAAELRYRAGLSHDKPVTADPDRDLEKGRMAYSDALERKRGPAPVIPVTPGARTPADTSGEPGSRGRSGAASGTLFWIVLVVLLTAALLVGVLVLR